MSHAVSWLEIPISIPTSSQARHVTFPIAPRSTTSKDWAAPRPPPTRRRAVTDPGSLQFERAERADAPSGLACSICKRPIATSYYEGNGQVACQRCRNQVMAQWNRESSSRRFAKALGLGLTAAAVGAGLYFGIEAATGYEFGLVAVVVGLLVGSAVRK